MALRLEILLLLLVLCFRIRRCRLQLARRHRIARLRLLVLATELIDQGRLLAAHTLLARRIVDGATVERHSWVRTRSRAFFPGIVSTWDGTQFKENFRVSRDTFRYLCSELQPLLEKRHNIRVPLSVQQRVALTLWRLGTTVEYRTISHLFGVGLSSVCVIVHEVCEAIVTRLGQKYIKIPQGEDILQVVDGFLSRWQFPQCAGALDGTHIPILAPAENHTDYFNRKGFHSVVMQALVDYRYRFMDIYIGWPGSVHDARVLTNSALFSKGETGTLLPNFSRNINGCNVPLVILGDPAYPLLSWLMKGYPESGNSTQKQRNFNYRLSRARFVVENAFGRLKGRWKCLSKRNDTSIRFLSNLIAACCILHNLCEVHGDTFDEQWIQNNIEVPSHETLTPTPPSHVGIHSPDRIRNALADYLDE